MFSSSRQLSGIVAAADRDQARIIRDAISRLVRLNRWLAGSLEIQNYRVVNHKTGSTLEIIASDAGTSYGLNPHFICLDELCHWKEAGQDLWDSLLSASAKRAGCLLTIISNAGSNRGHGWQWKIREAARESDSWYFSRLDGPGRRKVFYGRTKREVADKLKEFNASRLTVSDAKSITYRASSDRWLEDAIESRSPTTHARYSSTAKNHLVPYLGSIRLERIEPVHVLELYDQLKRNKVSADNRHKAGTLLGRMLKDAVRLKLIARNACADVDLPRVQRAEMKVWNAEETQSFLEESEKSERLHAMYVLAVATGYRPMSSTLAQLEGEFHVVRSPSSAFS